MGFWVDMNGDGREDFITARTTGNPGEGYLIWLEHPEEGLQDGVAWTEHIIVEGPDVDFEVEYGIYENEIVVYAAEFFNEQLSVHRVSLVDGTLVQSRVIDTTTLSAYSVTLTDLNGDGQKELLFNNHETDSATDGIWAYTVPSDVMSGIYNKITIETDFKNAFSIAVPNMSPGFPYAIWPEVSTKGQVPAHIAVAGDGDHRAHLLNPMGDRTEF